MPDPQDTSPATTSPSSPNDELVSRLEKQIRQTVAGTIGSLSPRLERLEKFMENFASDQASARVRDMSPDEMRQQLEAAAKERSAARPSAQEYFHNLAVEALEDSGLSTSDIDLPDFPSGKKAEDYAGVYRQFRKTIIDHVKESMKAEVERASKEAERRALSDAGLNVTDAGGGGNAGKQRFTWADVERMSPTEYAKHEDEILASLGSK